MEESQGNDDDAKPPKKKRKRKQSPPAVKAARKLVGPLVIARLDKLYLAPLHNPLFKRFFRQQPNRDGTFSLKKNPDIVMKLFKRLIRPILREILGHAAMNQPELLERYFEAALYVVKKRRANHVQRWRLTAKSMALKLPKGSTRSVLTVPGVSASASGSVVKSDASYEMQESKRKPRKRKRCVALDFGSSDDEDTLDYEQNGDGESGDDDGDESLISEESKNKKRKRVVMDFSDDSDSDNDADNDDGDNGNGNGNGNDDNGAFFTFPLKCIPGEGIGGYYNPLTSSTTILVGADNDDTAAGPPPCNFHQVKTKCKDCDKKIVFNSPFTQDVPNWEVDPKRPMRCRLCFDKFVQKEYVPKVHDGRESGQSERDAATAVMVNGKRQRTRRTSCKWCGATSHCMRSSKKCPLNPKSPIYDPNFTKPSDTPTDSIITPADPSNTPADPINTPADSSSTSTDAPSTPDVVLPEASVTPEAPAPVVTFNVGDCCIARWKRRQWYLAHITSANGGVYDVYFPGDGKTKKNLDARHVRSANGLSTPPMTRVSLLNETWWFKGCDEAPEGLWEVSAIKDNDYVCFFRGGDGKTQDTFDIGYVMRQVHKKREEIREISTRLRE